MAEQQPGARTINAGGVIVVWGDVLDPGDVHDKTSLIRHNRKAIEQSYNQKQYARILREAYARVANTAVKQRIDKRVLISAFLNLERFSLLKWNDYAE